MNMPIAVVTGASSGIGYSVTDELAARGYVVYACARRVDRIQPLVSKHGSVKIKPVELDISQYDEIKKFKEFLKNELDDQRIDLLYNNAGQSCTLAALDVTDEIMQRCYAVNVFGHVNMTRELSPMLIKAKGTIVFTGSVSGLVSIPFITTYSTTKAAIHQYARGLHLEMKPFGVRVINAITGGVATEIYTSTPFPEDVVHHFKEDIDKSQSRNKSMTFMSSSTYAKQMVDIIVSSSDPVDVYRGSFAWIIRFIPLLVPMWILKYVLYRVSGLNKTEKRIKEDMTKKCS